MKRMRQTKFFRTAAFAAAAFCLLSGSAAADGYRYIPYQGYAYDQWDDAQASAVAYKPDSQIRPDSAGQVRFASPVDFCIGPDGSFYILSAGAGGVTVLDKDQKPVRQIREFVMPDGSVRTLMNPNGLYVRDQKLYIADSDMEAVLVSDLQGKVEKLLVKQGDSSYPQDQLFRPQKVLADGLGNVYILLEGVYQGAATYNEQGRFTEFFGSNRIEATASVLAARFWRLFMTDEQIDNSIRNVPVEYTNFDIDEDNFIYSCTSINDTSTDELRKLTATGSNILPSANYGDMEATWFKNRTIDTHFVDVSVNGDGFIFGLDGERGRVFVYDNEGAPVAIFGGSGSQLGCFRTAAAIDCHGRSVYVLDKEKNAITVFVPTAYGNAVYDATVAFMDGRYQESLALWDEVIMQNANCLVGYIGIGKALYQTGQYEEAMRYFKLGGNRQQESMVFDDLRKNVMRKHTAAGIVILAAVFAAVRVSLYLLKKRRRRIVLAGSGYKETASALKEFRGILAHPSDGFDSMKYRKTGSAGLSFMIVLLWFIASVTERQYSNFRFNPVNTQETNIIFIFIATVVVFLFFTVANWSICTLFDGEGSFHDIWTVTGYALFPYVVSMFATTALGYALTTSEAAFMHFITAAGLLYSLYLLFAGMMQIHQYGFFRMLAALIFSVVGIFLVLFLCFLIMILFQQMGSFIRSVLEEILMRSMT